MFIELKYVKKCRTQSGTIFILEHFGRSSAYCLLCAKVTSLLNCIYINTRVAYTPKLCN